MKMKNRILSLLLIIPVLFSIFAYCVSAAAAKPVITSGNMVVIRSVDTGQTMLDSGDTESYVTPTVSAKLMTSLVAFDLAENLDAIVSVPADVLKKENVGSTSVSAPMIGLRPGETYTLRQLLQGTLISTANDACFTLAYSVSKGDIAYFVSKMNEKAASLGCKNTNYTDPVGLYSVVSPNVKPDNSVSYTTAHDVAVIASEFYKNNKLLDISSQASYALGGSTLPTKNYLLSKALIADYYKAGVKGMIAGQATDNGGYCLITSAEREGLGFVFVVMNAPGEDRKDDGSRSFPEGNAYTDIIKTVDWATTTFGYVNLVEEGDILGELPVKTAGDNIDHVTYVTKNALDKLLPTDVDSSEIERNIKLDFEDLEAPVEKDKKVGTLTLYYAGELLGTVDLVTSSSVERSKILDLFDKFKKFLQSSWLKHLIRIILIGLVCYLIFLLGCFVYRIIIKANAASAQKARSKQREQAKKAASVKKSETNQKK